MNAERIEIADRRRHPSPFKREVRRGMGEVCSGQFISDTTGYSRTHPHPNPPLEGEGVTSRDLAFVIDAIALAV